MRNRLGTFLVLTIGVRHQSFIGGCCSCPARREGKGAPGTRGRRGQSELRSARFQWDLGNDPPGSYARNRAAGSDARRTGSDERTYWRHSGSAAGDRAIGATAQCVCKTRRKWRAFERAVAQCNPQGFPRLMNDDEPFEFIMTKDKVLQVFQWEHRIRYLWTDGRAVPSGQNLDDLGPSWYGHSVANWDGNTLVVNTVGLDDRGWLDSVGHPKEFPRTH